MAVQAESLSLSLPACSQGAGQICSFAAVSATLVRSAVHTHKKTHTHTHTHTHTNTAELCWVRRVVDYRAFCPRAGRRGGDAVRQPLARSAAGAGCRPRFHLQRKRESIRFMEGIFIVVLACLHASDVHLGRIFRSAGNGERRGAAPPGRGAAAAGLVPAALCAGTPPPESRSDENPSTSARELCFSAMLPEWLPFR